MKQTEGSRADKAFRRLFRAPNLSHSPSGNPSNCLHFTKYICFCLPNALFHSKHIGL